MILKLDIAEGLVGVGKIPHYKLNMEICSLASYFPFSDISEKKLQIVDENSTSRPYAVMIPNDSSAKKDNMEYKKHILHMK